MSRSSFVPSRLAFRSSFVAVVLCAAVSSSRASTVAVTYDPSVVVPGQTQFTADTLNFAEYARTDLMGDNFSQSGFLKINNVSLNNSAPFVPGGLNSAYTLFFQFNGTGTMSLPSFNGSSTGTYNTLSYTLYEVAGASSFGMANAEPYVNNNGNTPTALAAGNLIAGSTSFSTAPIGAGANLSATFAQELAGFIASPGSTTFDLGIAENADQNVTTILNGGRSFTLNGSGGDLTLSGTPVTVAATPEPSSLALLGTGFMGALTVLRRRVRR